MYNDAGDRDMSDWISVDEAVRLSGYSAEQIRRLVRGRLIVAEKKGAMWWIDRASLSTYLKAANKSGDKRRGPKSGQ